MKKLMLLASCFAVLLVLSNVNVAQGDTAPVCPCPEVQMLTLPINHPGLSLNPREIRRTVRLDGRIATRQLRLEVRQSVPEAQYPYLPAEAAVVAAAPSVGVGAPAVGAQSETAQSAGTARLGFLSNRSAGAFFPGAAGATGEVEFAPAESYELPGGPVFQTGRRNNSSQRVTANNAPVINFLSLVRGPQPLHPPYYVPAQ